MRQYHVIFTDGTEKNFRAQDYEVRDGVLTLTNGDNLVVCFSAGEWKYVEAEIQDTK